MKYTKQKTTQRKPAVKGKTAFLVMVLFLAVLFVKESFGWYTIKYALLGILLLIISIIDYRWYIIPDELLAVALVVYMPLSLLTGDSLWQVGQYLILHGILAALPLLLFVLLADAISGTETMGFGDIKLFYVLGVYLGAVYAWLTLFISCIVALIWNMLFLRRKRNEPVPFGPSIALAAWFIILWGDLFMEWYIGFLH